MQNKNYFFTRQPLQWNALQQFICVLAFLLGLHTQGAWAITAPAANFLLPNGTLNTTAIGNQQFSLDLKGWNVSLDPTLGPVFAPAAADGFSALGTGLNGGVFAIAVSGSDVYVGGRFTSVGSGGALIIPMKLSRVLRFKLTG